MKLSRLTGAFLCQLCNKPAHYHYKTDHGEAVICSQEIGSLKVVADLIKNKALPYDYKYPDPLRGQQ